MSKGHEKGYVQKTGEGLLSLTELGQDQLETWVTDIQGDVYAMTAESDAQAVAAAMARLSRNPNDLRTILADEFLDEESRKLELLRRVVNKFGDDSVMQLYPMQLVFEGVSNLATKEVEWGRLAAYLEQSTRYLRFDKRDETGRYAYFTPAELDSDTTEVYEAGMDEIFDIYSDLYTRLYQYITETSEVPEGERDAAWRRACHAQACDGVRSLLPASTKATVGVVGSAQAINNMLHHMHAHELPEIRTLGHQALAAVRQVAPVFFERFDIATRGELITEHRRSTRDKSRELAERLLAGTKEVAEPGPVVRLLAVDGSEDEVIAKILADASSHSFETVAQVVSGLTSEDKQEVLATYVGERYNRRAKPGRALELPHYLFEVQCDYGAFRDIQRHRMVDGLEWQALDGKLGHITPDIIHEAGLADEYERAFTVSRSLYELLSSRGFKEQAQYATLFGHVMRFSMKVNARSLLHTAELRTSPQGHPTYRRVYQDMHAQIGAVHPHIAEAMRFVSQAEDEELARLGAERHHQKKYDES